MDPSFKPEDSTQTPMVNYRQPSNQTTYYTGNPQCLNNQQQPQQFRMPNLYQAPPPPVPNWYLDTSASNHVTPDLNTMSTSHLILRTPKLQSPMGMPYQFII